MRAQYPGSGIGSHERDKTNPLESAVKVAVAPGDWKGIRRPGGGCGAGRVGDGTLLERALDPRERHKLGAHYTPRAYVERLVLPTVVEPLRAEWQSVRAAAITHARAGDLKNVRNALK